MQKPCPVTDEALGEPPRPKPVLTSYLLGWGVAVILCGISGAIYWNNYAQEHYCFLMLEAAVLTCFVPAGVIILINMLIACRICCLLREPVHTLSLQRHPFDDPDTEETHDNEIEVLPCGHNQPDYRSVQSNSPAPSVEKVSELDPVYRAGVQLFAVIFILLLFCLTWMSAAFVIVPPFEFTHDILVYQCFYAVFAVGLGLFFVMYYCMCRSDIQSGCCCWKQPSSCESSRWQYVKATNGSVSHESRKLHENGSAVCHSRGVDESSAVLAPESLSGAAKSVHSDTDCATSTKISAAQFNAPVVAIPEGVAFYNARQNGIARKYWERSRKKRSMANLYRNETQLHRFGDESKPDGTSGNTTPDANVKTAVSDVHQKVVTAAVENVPQHMMQLPDEQQPLLSVMTPRSAGSDDHHVRTLSCTNSDAGTTHSNVGKFKQIPSSDTALMAVSSAEHCCKSDKQNCDTVQTCIKVSKLSLPTASELHASKESALQLSSSVNTAEQALIGNSNNLELHSIRDTNCLHVAHPQDNSEKDVATEECKTHSPSTGTARAFINKNYCASTARTCVPRTSDCKDDEVSEASQAVSDTNTADIWVQQNTKLLKLKSETSV